MMMQMIAALAALQAAPPAAATAPDPIQPPPAWFSESDYPDQARKTAAEGAVRVRLTIDAGGLPTDCAVEESAGPVFDAATCEILLARARFLPARDARGNPVAGTFRSRIAWRLPSPAEGLPFAPLRIVNSLEVGVHGTTRCSRDGGGAMRGPPGTEICGVALAMGLADRFRRSGADARMTLVLTVDPDRQAAPDRVAADPGVLVHRSEARVDVAPSGQLSVCVESGPRRGRGRLRSATPLCLAYLRGDGPDFAAQPAGARSGRIALSVYMVYPPER